MAVTEEGIPIRTVYVPELTINATHAMLRDYFREFGAIERVVISPERIHGNEPVDAANPVDFFNQQQNGQRNYFAYVTYVAQHGADQALQNTRHTIQNHETIIRAAFAWNQSPNDVQEYLTRVRTPNSLERLIYAEMPRLNDDCFLHILKYLGVLEIIRVTRSHPCFQAAATNHRHIRISRTGTDCNRMSLMQLRELLSELHFGENISSLYISSRMFSPEALHFVCDRLYCYIGPQLRSLTMVHFNLRSEQFERIVPILVNLEFFEADFSSSFNFQAFNIDWNRLRTLHIRTFGQLDRFLDGTERLPAFPVLSRLLIHCNLNTSQTLIERVVNSCPNLNEFIIVNVSDIFMDISRINPIAVNRMIDFQHLQRLVFSSTRHHFPNNFMDIICQMTSLQYLMIDVVKNRLRDDRVMDDVNQNLVRLGGGLPQLRQLHLIGVAIDNANILSFIDVALNLESIAILECPRFTCVPNFVRSIVERRSEMFRRIGLPRKSLKIFIDQNIFENVRPTLNENDLDDLVILQCATCYDLYKNCLPLETIDYMRNVRSQIAHAHAHNEHIMAGRRDHFFIRNDDGPFFGREGRRRRMMLGGPNMGRGGRMPREGFMFDVRMQPLEEPERMLELERQEVFEMLNREDPFAAFNEINERRAIDAFHIQLENHSDSDSD